MLIDLTRERAIPLSDVPKLPWLQGRGGRRLNSATVFRWASRGLRGRRLEYVQRGGTRVTTEAALLRFFENLASEEPRPAQKSEARRQHARQKTERELDEIPIRGR